MVQARGNEAVTKKTRRRIEASAVIRLQLFRRLFGRELTFGGIPEIAAAHVEGRKLAVAARDIYRSSNRSMAPFTLPMQPIEQRGKAQIERCEGPITSHAATKPIRRDLASQRGEDHVIDGAAEEESRSKQCTL